jgi:hypothetical protein
MKSRYVLLAAMLMVSALLVPARAQAYQPLGQIAVSGWVGGLKTDGRYVVWVTTQGRDVTRPHDLVAAALPDGQPTLLATGLHLTPSLLSMEGTFALDEGTVVWIEGSGDRRVLRSRKLATGQTLTVATGDVTLPAIAGNIVSWWEHVDAEYARRPVAEQEPAVLKARNIGTMDDPVVVARTTNTLYRFGPSRMSGSWIVWGKATGPGQGGLMDWELSAVRLGGGTPRVVGRAGYAVTGRFDLVGDRLVYLETNSSGRATFDFGSIQNSVHVVDLRSGDGVRTGPHGAVEDLTTDGRYVFWEKARDNFRFRDLWGFESSPESAWTVATGEVSVDPNSTSLPLYPSARGGVVAWLWNVPGRGSVIEVRALREALPSAPRDGPAPGEQFFAETGHTLRGTFKTFWERSGGLAVFGYPLTEEFIEKNQDTGKGHAVQYLERQRYELHPENAGTPYEVLLGRLGVEVLRRQGRDWQAEPKASPSALHYFAATGHAIAPHFWDYWRTHGLELGDPGMSEREALALFGYPITEPRMERNSSGDMVLTQWFERARFEHHPGNPEPYRVLLGRLSAEVLAERGW